NWGVEYILTGIAEGLPESAEVLYQGEGWWLLRLRGEVSPHPRRQYCTFTRGIYESPEGVSLISTPEQDIPGWYYHHEGRWLPFTREMRNPLHGKRGKLTLRYRPRGYLIGVLVGMLALCAISAWGFSTPPQKRKENETH
ncbi:MAG: hypothetical protein QXI19_12430, partial [Candidatus Caldarchaeum sp.]